MPIGNETVFQPQKVGHSMPFMTSKMLPRAFEHKRNSGLDPSAVTGDTPLTSVSFSYVLLLRGCEESRIERFFRYAVSRGADPATWTRSQFARMPNGTRENGRKQGIYYLNPAAAAK